MPAHLLILPLLLSCEGEHEYIEQSCRFDWTGAPCSTADLDRVRCDPCGKAWACRAQEPADPEAPWPIWELQDYACGCKERFGAWWEEGDCAQ
ncbi:hypothetical protein L6R53_20110 [Myxococcota bacterium]|nr:hypothetical protein [Myxococcota bacterium]